MPAPTSPQRIAEFDMAVIREGMSTAAAARKTGCGLSWAYARVAKLKAQGRVADYANIKKSIESGPIPYGALCSGAKQGWDDFAAFRLRYMGRTSTPWQVQAAVKIAATYESDRREYGVMNVAPGAGKTTLMVDIAAWLTVRNRGIRGLIGSGTQPKAEKMLRMLRAHLDRPTPMRTDEKSARYGTVDAQATLAQDYGLFRPLDRETGPWRTDALLVVQPGFAVSAEKEFTWAAYGLDTDYLGDRVDFMLWDDAVVPRDYRTLERIEMRQDNFDTVTESRLEPDGALWLVGQRILANDLYRHCLDKRRVPDDDATMDALEAMSDVERTETEREFAPLYEHVVYKAHSDDKCNGDHSRAAKPYPDGCLLDPRRLPYSDLRSREYNNPGQYATWYQQEDGSQSDRLVPMVWIDGGTDPATGVLHYPAWDSTRGICELPKNLTGPLFSFATVDPSPTRMWAVQWWVVAPNAANGLFLMDLFNGKMGSDEFLEWRANDGEFVGLAEQWQTRSERLGFPITHWVVEHNGAQRFLLQQDYVRRWTSTHGISIVPHTTAMNKNDPEFGVYMLREPFRTGRVNLPRRDEQARLTSLKLADQVSRYGAGGWYDDQVMAMWFLVSRLPNLTVVANPQAHQLSRPSWAAGLNAGRRLMSV